MATFGKRVQPKHRASKHRASPSDHKREVPPVARPGAHAAAASPAPVAPPAVDPARIGVAPAEVEPVATAPVATTPVGPPPVDVARVEAAPAVEAPPVEAAPPSLPPPLPPAQEAVQPVALPAAPVSASEPEPEAVDAGPLRVLVVDDNEDVRGLLRMAFARAGINVIGAAGDSHEALAMAQQDRPGIILLDVNLPQVAGLDLLPQLREQCPRARVVMFSAQCSNQVAATAMERGAVGFVEKGVSMKHVIAHLHQVARAPEAQVVEPFPLKVYA